MTQAFCFGRIVGNVRRPSTVGSREGPPKEFGHRSEEAP